jgi:hypothetical protein
MKKVDIRFNTNFPSRSQYEWRVLINGDGVSILTLFPILQLHLLRVMV